MLDGSTQDHAHHATQNGFEHEGGEAGSEQAYGQELGGCGPRFHGLNKVCNPERPADDGALGE